MNKFKTNTVLVNVKNNPNKYWGFWYMNDEMANSVEYLASHDNVGVLQVRKIVGRTKVMVLDENVDYLPNGDQYPRNTKTKWTFHCDDLGQFENAYAIKQLSDIDLKGVRGVRYDNIEL